MRAKFPGLAKFIPFGRDSDGHLLVIQWRRSVIHLFDSLLRTTIAAIHLARGSVVALADRVVTVARHELGNAMRMPVTSWSRRDAVSEEWSAEELKAFHAAVGRYSSGCIIKDGALIFAWGEPNRNGDWGSASKAVYATMLMFAIQEGLLDSADDRITDYVPGLSQADQTMTFRQLLDMTSGYTLPEPPGKAWAYNDYGIQLFRQTLYEGIFDTAVSNVAAAQALLEHPRRLGPLSFEDGNLFKIKRGAIRLNMSPRDYARVGVFWLNRGKWNERQILDASLFDRYFGMAVPDCLPRSVGGPPDDYLGIGSAGGGNNAYALGPGSFGFTFWLNDARRLWPDVPADAFQANGHENRAALTVIPSLGLVVSWLRGDQVMGNSDDFNHRMNDVLRLLLKVLPDLDDIQLSIAMKEAATSQRRHAR